MRQRKPRIDLIGFENDYGIVIRTDNPSSWIIKCKSCNKEHEQSSREIKSNSAPRLCENFRPYNKLFDDKRDGIVRRQYGITLAQYEQMLRDQDNKCAICGNEDEVEGRRLAVDHCHQNGNIRGLLCGKCNRGIGLFYDNPKLLEKAISYLTKFANAR